MVIAVSAFKVAPGKVQAPRGGVRRAEGGRRRSPHAALGQAAAWGVSVAVPRAWARAGAGLQLLFPGLKPRCQLT